MYWMVAFERASKKKKYYFKFKKKKKYITKDDTENLIKLWKRWKYEIVEHSSPKMSKRLITKIFR